MTLGGLRDRGEAYGVGDFEQHVLTDIATNPDDHVVLIIVPFEAPKVL